MTLQTFTGREYLMIDIASNYGHDNMDRKTWAERIAWFKAHEPILEQMDHKAAKEPALFFAGVKAYRDVQAGKPIGYMVSLDATASGLQLLAALTGDRSAAQICNVVDTGQRADAYTTIYEAMLSVVGEEAQIDREGPKSAVMKSLYGSTAEPKKVFGEGALLNVFYDTMETLTPAAWELNQAFLGFWDPNALVNSWVLPDNFHVHVKVMNTVCDTIHFLNAPYDVTYKVNQPMEEGRSLGANSIHSIDGMVVREMTRRCDYDPAVIARVWNIITKEQIVSLEHSDDDMVDTLWAHYLASGYLSARILDHLDTDNINLVDIQVIKDLLVSLPAKPFKVIAIHDCFRCLPHYANDLRQQYALQLQLIGRSKLLEFLISQILGRHVPINQLDPNLHLDIGSTNYALS